MVDLTLNASVWKENAEWIKLKIRVKCTCTQQREDKTKGKAAEKHMVFPNYNNYFCNAKTHISF